MQSQCTLRLKAERLPGEPRWHHQARQHQLNTTLADHLAAMEITRRDLRAPAFVSRQTSEHAAVMEALAAVQRQNDALAAMMALRNGGAL